MGPFRIPAQGRLSPHVAGATLRHGLQARLYGLSLGVAKRPYLVALDEPSRDVHNGRIVVRD